MDGLVFMRIRIGKGKAFVTQDMRRDGYIREDNADRIEIIAAILFLHAFCYPCSDILPQCGLLPFTLRTISQSIVDNQGEAGSRLVPSSLCH